MFNFLRRSSRAHDAATIKALVDDGLPAGLDPGTLTVLERRGSYSGRAVTYFRAFDGAKATVASPAPRRFEDLNDHPELIIGAGWVEHGGAVVLSPRTTMRTDPTPARLLADRGTHGDDERVVFPAGRPS